MKDYKPRLRKLLQKPLWKVVLFMLTVWVLRLWTHAIDFYFYHNFNFLFGRRAFVKRTSERMHVRAHWVRAQVEQPHRLAFFMLFLVLLFGTLMTPHIQGMLYWCIGWGAVFSLFVTYRSLALILQRAYEKLN